MPGRDAFTGWGHLDIQAALTDLTTGPPLPPPDRYEPNDDAGPWSHALPPLPRTISATLDYWDDQIDVYRVVLKKGQRLFARLTPEEVAATRLALWRPGTKHLDGLDAEITGRLVQSKRAGGQERLAYTARVSGTYYLEAKLIAPVRDTVSSPALAREGHGALIEQLLGRHVAPDAGGVAVDDLLRRHVLGDDGPGPDEGFLADLDTGTEDRAAADARTATDRRALDQVVPLLGSAHEVVVRRDDAGRDEDVLLERRVRGDIGVGLDLGQRPDRRVVLDQRAAADDHVVADAHALADAGLVAEDDARTDL